MKSKSNAPGRVPTLLGLDVGITLLSAENLRTGNLWKWFMRNSEISRAMKLAGLQGWVLGFDPDAISLS